MPTQPGLSVTLSSIGKMLLTPGPAISESPAIDPKSREQSTVSPLAAQLCADVRTVLCQVMFS